MLYIFLDVDGVLNCEADWKQNFILNDTCVRYFAEAVKKCGTAKIVLISSWKNGYSYVGKHASYVENLQMYLRKYGLEIVGKLPNRPCVNRSEAIVDYVVDHDIEKFIIVDDDASLYSPKCKFLFLVDPKKGFSEADVNRVCERFQKIYAETMKK